MHLMALADTVASCKLNLCDRFAIDAAKAAMSKDNPATTTGGEPTPGTSRAPLIKATGDKAQTY
jgi:hypothetical protein